jgi:uncharacterized protein (TIGR02265 family)
MSTQERLVFASSVESLLVQGLKDKLSPQLVAELRQEGIDLTRPLLPAYSSAAWNRALDRVATSIYPELSRGEAQFRLGQQTVFGLDNTLIGRASVALAKLVGPRRALLRVPHNARNNATGIDMTVRDLDAGSMEIVANGFLGEPEFLQGALAATVVVAGGKDPQVEILEFDRAKELARFRVRWTA